MTHNQANEMLGVLARKADDDGVRERVHPRTRG